MGRFLTYEETTTKIDEEGNEQTTKVSKNSTIIRNNEPDYIKIYTNMWCEFNAIPVVYREFFLQLIMRMSYCNTQSLGRSQIVFTGKPYSDDIKATVHWGDKMYEKALKELQKCGAIKRVARAVYQINPKYAGKGEWKYNPRLNRGGVEDLVATFNLRKKTVDLDIIWADDGEDNALNDTYREGMRAKADEELVITQTVITPFD